MEKAISNKPLHQNIVDKIWEFNPPKKVYVFVLILFLLLSAVVSAFHEPWHDEAQAWMIARDGTYYEMLFFFPHYEGHPSLWWLLLSIPAKLGAPYELSLKAVILIISAVNAYLILFKSPLRPMLKICLPFTFYFFYQYGIISRPYGLMAMAFLLAAITYKDRNEKPFRYVFTLIFLCLTSAYGIVISGGLAIVWCIEILQEYKLRRIFTEFIRTRRFASLCLLLLTAVLLIIQLLPYEDTYVVKPHFSLIATLAFISTIVSTTTVIGSYNLSVASAFGQIIAVILGLIIIAIFCDYLHSKKKLLTFIVPYALFCFFATSIYAASHHWGIFVLLAVFILWICADYKSAKQSTYFEKAILKATTQMISINNIYVFIYSIFMLTGIIFSVSSSAVDIKSNYYFSRDIAQLLKENELDKLNVFVAPLPYNIQAYGYHANIQIIADAINPYFDKNIFFNHNNGNENMAYTIHSSSKEINDSQYQLWRQTVPDILVGEFRLETAYSGTSVNQSDYICIKTVAYQKSELLINWRNYNRVYLRKDLFKYYPNIKPENPADYELIEGI